MMQKILTCGLLVGTLACSGEEPFEPGPPPGYDPEGWFRAVEIELGLNVDGGGTAESVQILVPGPVTPPGPPNEPEPSFGEFFWHGSAVPIPYGDSPVWIQRFEPDGNGGWKAEVIATAGDNRDPAGLYGYRIVIMTHVVDGVPVTMPISNRALFCVDRCP